MSRKIVIALAALLLVVAAAALLLRRQRPAIQPPPPPVIAHEDSAGDGGARAEPGPSAEAEADPDLAWDSELELDPDAAGLVERLVSSVGKELPALPSCSPAVCAARYEGERGSRLAQRCMTCEEMEGAAIEVLVAGGREVKELRLAAREPSDVVRHARREALKRIHGGDAALDILDYANDTGATIALVHEGFDRAGKPGESYLQTLERRIEANAGHLTVASGIPIRMGGRPLRYWATSFDSAEGGHSGQYLTVIHLVDARGALVRRLYAMLSGNFGKVIRDGFGAVEVAGAPGGALLTYEYGFCNQGSCHTTKTGYRLELARRKLVLDRVLEERDDESAPEDDDEGNDESAEGR